MPSGEGLGSVPSLASTASLTRALPTRPRRYESIGWNMQRFNSNVHREASLTISMGAQPADPPIGPRGALPPASEPVIQIYYKYSCKKIKQPADGSLASLVLAAADGESAELTDPDGYTVLLSNE